MQVHSSLPWDPHGVAAGDAALFPACGGAALGPVGKDRKAQKFQFPLGLPIFGSGNIDFCFHFHFLFI